MLTLAIVLGVACYAPDNVVLCEIVHRMDSINGNISFLIVSIRRTICS